MKEKRKESKPPSRIYQWFGILPLGCIMFFKRHK
ncbi:YqzE family protein [Bacillus haynesii]|nr:YqzE family protein [Bacillus haynesii]MCY9150179.1 YqzE family protein [Bacillus haynesii]